MTEPREYDSALKLLFSHPEMMISLIKTFVSDSWTKDLDFSTLAPMKSEYISQYLKVRRNDLLWKIQFRDKWLYLLFLLEFQSEQYRFMPVRILTYGGLIYEDLIKSKNVDLCEEKLPPIFPVVFYTGSARWKSPTNFRECLSAYIPTILMNYQFESRYLVLDLGCITIPNELKKEEELIYSLIELEHAKTLSEVNIALMTAYKRLKGRADSLKRAFLMYSMKALKVQERFPEAQLERLSEFSMLYERADQIWDEFENANRQEGHRIGKHEERKAILTKMLEKKFPTQYTASLKAKLDEASEDQLLKWLDELIEERFQATSC